METNKMAVTIGISTSSNDSNGATAESEASTVAPSKRRSDTRSVARAVVRHRKNRAADLKKDLEDKITVLKQKQHNIKRERIALLELKKTKKNLQDAYDNLVFTKRSELVEKYRKDVTRLKQHPYIEKFEVDTERRVVITTRPIMIKQEDWVEEKNAGRYQIRIDFSKSSYREAIRVLNITQRHKEYDSPTILSTSPCWGNTDEDFDKEFKEQNLFELVIDLIDYISSPIDHHGFSKWNQFFENAKPWPEGFTFEQYDQNEESKKVIGIGVGEAGAVTYQQHTISHRIDSLQSAVAWNGSVSSYTINGTVATQTTPAIDVDSMYDHMVRLTAATETRHQYERRVMDHYQYEVMTHLRGLGFTENSAYHFSGLLTADNIPMFRIELRYRSDFIEVIVEKATSPTIRPFFANHGDFNSENLADLERRRRVAYRFAPITRSSLSRWISSDEMLEIESDRSASAREVANATEEMARRRSHRVLETNWSAGELRVLQDANERASERLYGRFSPETFINTDEDLSPPVQNQPDRPPEERDIP